MSETTNRIIKNTGFLYIKMGITVFFSLYTTRLILNALGVIDFGVFGIVGGAIAMMGFLNSSLSNATQRFMSYYQGKNDVESQITIFNNSMLLHCIIAFIVVIILEIAAIPLFNGVLTIPSDRLYAAQSIYQFMIITTFFTILAVPYDASVNAHENMFYYAVVGILEAVLKLVIALYVVYTSLDRLIIYGLLMSVLAVILLFIKYAYCRYNYRECQLELRRYCDFMVIKEQISYAGWNFLGTTGGLIGNNGGDIVMNHYFGPAINAAGNVGSQLRGQMMAFSNNMLKALNPVIIKKEGRGDRQSMLKFSMSGSKLSYMLFAVFALPFVVEAPYILKLWLVNVPGWTVCFSRFQMLTGLGEQLTITLATSLAAIGKIKQYNIFSGLVHLLPLFLYCILFHFGASPYWPYLITFIDFVFVLGGYTIYLGQKECGLNAMCFLGKLVIPAILYSAVAIGLGSFVALVFPETIWRLLAVIVVTDVVFILLFYCFLMNQEERSVMRGVALKLTHRI